MDRLREKLEGYKTYILLALLIIAEVANLGGFLPVDIVAIRVIVLPLIGGTVNAKLNRTLL